MKRIVAILGIWMFLYLAFFLITVDFSQYFNVNHKIKSQWLMCSYYDEITWFWGEKSNQWLTRINDVYMRDGESIYTYKYRCSMLMHEPCNCDLRKIALDTNSVKVLDNSYIKDKDFVYVEWYKIKEADSDTFEVLSSLYGKDKDNIYYYTEVVKWVNYESFKVIDNKWEDKYWDFERWYRSYPDAQKLSYNWIDTWYAIDKDYVFYSNSNYLSTHIIEWVDKDSFVVISSELAKDKNFIYYEWMPQKWIVDIETYKSMPMNNTMNSNYARDQYNIYYIFPIPSWWYSHYPVEWVDYDSFEVHIKNRYRAQDKNNRYYKWEIEKI